MQISISTNNTAFKPVTVSKLEEFGKLTQEFNWSPGLYKDNYRNKANFLLCECVGLDIDNDEDVKMSLEEARETFKDYKHIIIPSKSHRKEKNGEIKDRYRVILFLSTPITDEAVYNATWQSLQNQFPAIDPACRDTCRFYYPSRSIVSSNMKGKPVDPVSPVETAVDRAILETAGVAPVLESQGGELSRKTLKFMHQGARPGQTHRELYLSCRDYHQNNFSEEQYVKDLSAMITRTGNWPHSKLTAKDLTTIKDAFSKDPKHEARYGYQRALIWESVGDILESEETFEWLCDGLLQVGGISIISGSPKKGKSTLIRQLSLAIARGKPFLGRKTKKGTVRIMAFEEQRALLKKQLKAAGVTNEDAIQMHVGSPLSQNVIETLEDDLDGVDLLVCDTFQLGLRIKELQNYTEVNDAITPYRDLARATGTHIVFVHHSNKSGVGSNSVSGSKGIAGAVDTVMLFQDIGKKRFLSTEGRGVKPFYQHQLIYDEKTEFYTLGKVGGFDEDNSF